MRIVEADLDRYGFLGLSGSMRTLGNLVVLAGPNGGGKSRILTAVSGLAGAERPDRPGADLELSQLQGLADLGRYGNPQARESQTGDAVRSIRGSSGFLIEGPFVASRPIHYAPVGASLRSHRDAPFGEPFAALSNLTSLGPGLAAQSALGYIYALHHRVMVERYRSRELGSRAASDEVPGFERQLEEMQAMLRALVGSTSAVTPAGDVLLFERPAPQGLSPGQTVLIQLAVMLHAQSSRIEDVILLLDEPENHLHPSALIQVINRVLGCCKNGQVWVATHSLPLIASFPLDSVWYVEGGKPRWAGRSPELVINGLVGSSDNADRIAEFTALPARFALSNFAAECLTPPGVAPAKAKDPQSAQLRRLIYGAAKAGSKLRVLDYGAGQSRLLVELVDALGPERLRDAVDYVAYDEDVTHAAVRESAIREAYGDVEGRRLLSDETSLMARTDASSFDLVVLCNVLHEIPSQRWVELLKNTLVGRLAKGGHLLVAELMEMPIGELAHSSGFHVLGHDLLRHLFALKESETVEFAQEQGRLEATLVSREFLERITHDTVRATLGELKRQAKGKVIQLRQRRGRTYKDGLAHAFWAMQLANAEIALAGG